MKILIQPGDYTFTAAAKTISFDNYVTIDPENIILITNVTDGIIIYNFADPFSVGTVAGNVLTLDYDTTLMSDTDNIQIYFWDITATQNISGTITTGGLTDIELRASPVNVDTGLIQGLTDAELRASPVPVTFGGSVTDGTVVYTDTLVGLGAITGIDTSGYEALVIQTTGEFVATIGIEASNDNLVWHDIFVTPVDEPSRQQNIQEQGIFFIKANAKYVRLNVTSYQSGSVDVLIVGRTVYGGQAIDNLSYALDKSNNMPLYVEDIRGSLKRDEQGALILSDGQPVYFNKAAGSNASVAAVTIDTTGYQSVIVQCTALTVTAGTTQTSSDGINWISAYGMTVGSSVGASSATISSSSVSVFPVSAKYFRIVQSTNGTMSGYISVRSAAASVVHASIQAFNLVTINGSTPSNVSGQSSTGGTSTLGVGFVVGGTSDTGSTNVTRPIIIGGAEAPRTGALAGVARTLLTDSSGRLILGGLPTTNNIQNTTALPVIDLSRTEGDSNGELLKQLLTEMKIMNQYLFELPSQLQLVLHTLDNPSDTKYRGFTNEPQEFRNDPTIFN